MNNYNVISVEEAQKQGSKKNDSRLRYVYLIYTKSTKRVVGMFSTMAARDSTFSRLVAAGVEQYLCGEVLIPYKGTGIAFQPEVLTVPEIYMKEFLARIRF